MFVFPLDIWSQIIGLLQGTTVGLPTLVIMAIPFIVGIVVGFLVKKFLKWAIIAFVVLIVLAFFGVWGLNFATLTQWGGIALQWGILIVGVLPLTFGFVIGLILGFVFG